MVYHETKIHELQMSLSFGYMAGYCHSVLCYFCDRVIPHALYVIANLHIVSKDVYINAHRVIIMINVELLRLLMIYIEI